MVSCARAKVIPNAVLMMLASVQMTSDSVGQDCAHKIHVVDLARTRVNSLEELVHLVIAHLLAEICQDVTQLTDTDEASHVLVEDLKTAAVFFGLAGISETARSVKDFAEGIEVDCPLLELFFFMMNAVSYSRRRHFSPGL
jgi:hypothetical protein